MTDRDLVVNRLHDTFGDRLEALEERMATVNEASPPELDPEAGVDDIANAAAAAIRQRLLTDGAAGLSKVVTGRADDLTSDEQNGLEAIILLEGRPPLFVQNGDFVMVPPEWTILDDHRAAIRQNIARVGRIEVEGHPDFAWLGTGFLAGPDAIITNRHVAAEFAAADGPGWTFQAGMSARLDFNEEHGALAPREFAITGIIGIHDQHDLAVLRVEPSGGSGNLPDPLVVASAPPGGVVGRKVYVIGYPAWDGRRNDPAQMRQLFANTFDVKRLQPGQITDWPGRGEVIHHDCSTLGGNSGSPVVDLDTHQVVGLHFRGRYLVTNNAVPLWRLTGDDLLTAAGITFA